MNKSRNIPFTLIELLMVIAIIVMLMAILLPSLRNAKESARQSLCRSNLKQCGTAFTLYANDNNDWLPDNRFSWRIPAAWGYDANIISPNYLSSWTVADCPSNFYHRQPWDIGARCLTEYSYMGYETANYAPLSATRLTGSAGLLLVGDEFTDPAEPTSEIKERNHQGGANWCYLDLHTVWVPKANLGYYKYSQTNHAAIWYHLFPIL